MYSIYLVISDGAFTESVAASLMASIIWAGLSLIVLVIWDFLKKVFFSVKYRDLSGVWAGLSQTAVTGEYIVVDLVAIKQREDGIEFKNWYYKKDLSKVYVYQGKGKYLDKEVACYYRCLQKENNEIGAVVLKLDNHHLSGSFMQYDKRPGNTGMLYRENTYSLYKVKIPLFRQVYKIFRRKYFSNFQSALSYIGNIENYKEKDILRQNAGHIPAIKIQP